MIYLASPYNDEDPALRVQRFEAACDAAGRLLQAGELVFSPIAHTHPIAERCDLPKGFEFWQRLDRWHLERCSELVVLRLPGWDTSRGVRAEMKMASELDLPVRFVDR